jgi:hypothetical protein
MIPLAIADASVKMCPQTKLAIQRMVMQRIARRTFLKSARNGPILFCGLLPFRDAIAQTSSAHNVKDDTITKDEWIDAVIRARTADSPLYLGRFRDPMYFLIKPISWKPNKDQEANYVAVDVPEGFVTDLASIPQVFWNVLRPDGDYAYAAIVHDYLYWTQTTSKETADEILKFAMQDFQVATWKIDAIYGAVSTFGRAAWDEDARLKGQGEARVLKTFPPNAGILWSDWKKQPDVLK